MKVRERQGEGEVGKGEGDGWTLGDGCGRHPPGTSSPAPHLLRLQGIGTFSLQLSLEHVLIHHKFQSLIVSEFLWLSLILFYFLLLSLTFSDFL